jgi:DNA-binding LacI/PurR family transcriptional regulator
VSAGTSRRNRRRRQDTATRGLARALNDAGLAVVGEAILESELAFPGEVSLLGFDDLEWTTIVRPSLSVVAQPAYELGAAAARLLVSRLGGDRSPPQMLLLESTLVHRDSVAAPASA